MTSETNTGSEIMGELSPPAGQRIDQLHVWVATHADGSEGIISARLPRLGDTPLLSSKRAVAEMMAILARQAAQGVDEVTSVRLVSYRRVVE